MTGETKWQEVVTLVVGGGQVAEYGYLPALHETAGGAWAVVEPDTARASALRQRLGAGLDVLPRVPPAPHVPLPVALNLTPAPVHEAVSEELLELGWNVMTEKPAAVAAGNWRSLISVAKTANLRIVSAPFTYSAPPVTTLRRWCARSIDAPLHMRIDATRRGPVEDGELDDARRWFLDAEQGPLTDLAPYALAIIVDMLGMPARMRGKVHMFDVPVRLRRGDTWREVVARLPAYQVTLEWATPAIVELICGYEATDGARYNVKATRGPMTLRASTWDYSAPVWVGDDVTSRRIDLPATNKYVHALEAMLESMSDPVSEAANHRIVAGTLELVAGIRAAVVEADLG